MCLYFFICLLRRSSLGWHSDDEKLHGPNPYTILSLRSPEIFKRRTLAKKLCIMNTHAYSQWLACVCVRFVEHTSMPANTYCFRTSTSQFRLSSRPVLVPIKFYFSFGGARDFEIRSTPRNATSNLKPLTVRLRHGQLLSMNGYFQDEFEHMYYIRTFFFDDSQYL